MRRHVSFRLAAVATAALLAASASQGQSFSVIVNPLDIWSEGPALRRPTTDGLNGPLFAQQGDDFGAYTQGNLTASFGSLVGRIGKGDFSGLDTSFSGTLSRLSYWDVSNRDNFSSVKAEVNAPVTAISEPETYALMLAGLGVIGFLATRRHG